MQYQFDYGDKVRVIRNVRNDGTYPGKKTGELLVRRGSLGYVKDVGTFLQDQVIYSVDFVDEQRIVGCRAEELIAGDDPWIPSEFESREKVYANRALAINGDIVVDSGALGEVVKVIRDPSGVSYHVHFPGQVLQVPENALTAAEE